MKLLPTWMCIFLYLSSLFHNSESHTINGKPLHHLMTKEEIKRYFGAEHLSNVPEYDVTLPYETNEEGNFASYSLNHRLKRSIEDDAATYHYKINALGEQLHLQVKRNTKFMAPGLKLETRDEKGQRVAKTVSRNAYLTGRVPSDPDSVVALSVREGLTGIVKRSGDTFLIHPLPTRLARHFKGKEGAKPHLIYRRSSQENDECLTKTDKMSHEKRDLISSETTSHIQEDSNNNGETEKYLEVAILADEQVVEIHGPYAEDHLLLLASIVDVGIFQDTTIGDQKINFVATRLVLINGDELGVDSSNPTISHWDVIGKVRAWAHSNNKQDESDPLQFDVAVLIRGGGTGGLAAFGGICQRNDVVSVVKENGLQTAYFIAHEVAHNLGVSHDSQGASAACPNLVNIMSTVGEKGPGSWEWSSCSKENIQNFLMSQRSACLDDPPPPTRPKPPASFYTELPGELVDADDQCQLQYGPEYRQCPQRKSNCDSLYCTPNGYTCLSRVLRPVDGTPCGLRHWCIKGYCVDNGSPLINGGWSEWSDYTACTPSCRGGVRYRERTCTNPPPQNGGEDCEGLSRALWETCNNDVPCDTSEPSFRDQQCKQINPNYSAYDATDRNPCSLACQSESSYHFHGDVIDGTRCLSSNLNVYDVCIEGECKAVGCDRILNSGKVKDRCGVCDGNGDTCTLEEGSYMYTKDDRKHPLDTIAVLPPGTSNAIFKQKNVKQYNIIGVQFENKTYVIPLITWSKKITYYKGTRISYVNDYESPDLLEIDGPTNVPLKIVYVHLWTPNVVVDYQYYRPLESNEIPVTPLTCHWITSDWTDCSTGQQTREVRCVRSDDLTSASTSCCGEDSKPDTMNLCFGWHASNWQACTKTCGKGSQSRAVVCRARVNDADYQIGSDASCNEATKPIATRYCNEVNCPAYRTAHWTKCSTVCLPGERTNYTKCSRTNALGETEEVSDMQCEYEARPPSVSETCNDDNPCKEYMIGCFNTTEGVFSEILGDFRDEAKTDRNQVLMQCGELAHDNDYRVFALGFGGLCMSGADAQDKYYKHRQPGNKGQAKKCSNEIGQVPFSVVYSFDPLPEYEPVGCFKDKRNDRALSKKPYANFRFFIDWYNLNATIRQCAMVARDIGYEYFAVQYYAECWSSFEAAENYNRHGVQTDLKKCQWGVGGRYTNYVYRFKQLSGENSVTNTERSYESSQPFEQ